MIDVRELFEDLELKRAAALGADELAPLDPAAALEGLPTAGIDAVVRDAPGAGRGAAELVARMAAEAVAVAAAARGEADGGDARDAVRAAVADALGRLAGSAPGGEVSLHDLSALVEAAFIRVGRPAAAKALVMRRAMSSSGAAPAAGGVRLIRRSGHVVAWRTAKIEAAVRRAFLSLGADPAPASRVAARVTERAIARGSSYVHIEDVQDIVQEELVLEGHMRVAERYILYRAERAVLRARQAAGAPEPAGDIAVVEADGRAGTWDGEDLRERIRFASIGLDLTLDAVRIEAELRRSIRPGVRRDEIGRVVVLNAKALVERDAEFSSFAGRILLTYVYEETLGWDILRDGVGGLREAHRRGLRAALERGVAIGRIDPALLGYDLDRLAAAIDPTADLDAQFLGVQTLYDRYLVTDKTGPTPVRIEAPQVFWMRVAMGVCLAEREDRERRVLDLYGAYKERRFCSSTPTLFNAGTQHPQLSSCYLYVVDDSLESIMRRGIAENAMCSKWAGGLGGSWTRVRGTGSHIRGTDGESQGVVPFLKLHNDQLVAVNQGGKRAGSGCAYLEVWHNDIRDFLELRRGTGDERRRTHDMNTACWIPDLFMKRVEAREGWTLFRSSDVPDLHDLHGRAFEERYARYEAMAAEGRIHGETIPAIELWKAMLRMLFETGHPWITFKDPCNVRSPQDHAGVVHSSNLCTEITLNTSDEETAVCNLGSIVIDRHLDAEGRIDHARLRETVRVAVRALDDVIDVNFHPTEAAARANARHRPVGLGVMGLQYALYRRGAPFASPEAVEFSDEMMEAIAFYAYEASSDLAAERGRYPSYEGSKWDRGILPQDTLDLLEAERGLPVDAPRGGRMDWGPLRERIARQGMRNSNVLAIAPTATIANIMGTSPCVEPLYRNLFAKSNLSGDFTVLNPFLVRDLKAAGAWSERVADEIKYFDGDLREVEGIPQEIRDRYPTAFDIDPAWLIDAAARRAKWIDQSQSLNLFLGAPDMRAMSHMYRRAWHAGLKTTYYLRTLGASGIDKSTVAARPEAAPACPVDAGPDCEACQ
ncbi:ribonucleoside-diphosphate reductase subunit alpha [Miltoncostaea marina]|uniref:ribonucleoside-diphosphate reductase subunit alpha n=1 Tax=Miltoncostaea marina TaxID=2843215 RepID=UPI003CCEBDBF